MTEALAGAIDRDEVARVIVEAASGALDADAGALAIVDEGDAELEIVSVGGFDEPSLAVAATIPLAGVGPSRRSSARARSAPIARPPSCAGTSRAIPSRAASRRSRSCCSGTRIACWVASS